MRINSLSKEFKISTPYGRIKNIHGNNMTPEQQSISQSVNKNKIFEINRKRIEELQKLTSQCERETDKIYQVIQNNINMMSFE
jgi:hypothetical protein